MPCVLLVENFLIKFQNPRGEIIRFGVNKGHWASWIFLPALGELRGIFGIYIAKIATSYGLDIESDLASILPQQDSEKKND